MKSVDIVPKTLGLQVPDGLGVRIPGFHPGGPGSIPGLGEFLYPRVINEEGENKFSTIDLKENQFIWWHMISYLVRV